MSTWSWFKCLLEAGWNITMSTWRWMKYYNVHVQSLVISNPYERKYIHCKKTWVTERCLTNKSLEASHHQVMKIPLAASWIQNWGDHGGKGGLFTIWTNRQKWQADCRRRGRGEVSTVSKWRSPCFLSYGILSWRHYCVAYFLLGLEGSPVRDGYWSASQWKGKGELLRVGLESLCMAIDTALSMSTRTAICIKTDKT